MMQITQIAVNIRHPEVGCWNFLPRHAEQLQRLMPGVSVCICETDAAFEKSLPEADACMVWRFRQEWFSLAGRLKVLSTPAAGKDYFHVTPPSGLVMLNGQFHGRFIAETVVGALLGMSRGLFAGCSTFAGASWPRRQMDAIMRPLRGSHVVILGFGRIGQWIGQLLKPFGVRISGMRRNMEATRPEWFTEEDEVFRPERLDEVLPTADHVVLALPGGQETDEILDAHRIALLPRHATVTNIGRGNAIAEMPLYAALDAGRLAGAFLDVFSEEPLPEDSILRKCPNLWRLPHASAISPDYLDIYVEDFARQLKLL